MIRFGELSDADRERQTEAFVRWYGKDPSGDWRERFKVWADSKDLHPGDRWAIASVVGEIMLAGGASTLTDPMEWLEIARDPADEPAA